MNILYAKEYLNVKEPRMAKLEFWTMYVLFSVYLFHLREMFVLCSSCWNRVAIVFGREARLDTAYAQQSKIGL